MKNTVERYFNAQKLISKLKKEISILKDEKLELEETILRIRTNARDYRESFIPLELKKNMYK